MISKIEINGQCFKAWPLNEFPHLVTLILPQGTEIFEDNTWPLFLAQNGIKLREHGRPKVAPLTKGYRRLIVGASANLAKEIRKLEGKEALGGFTVTANVSKEPKT